MRIFEAVKQFITPLEKDFLERARKGFNLEKVLNNLREKHKNSENSNVRSMLLIPGGGMKIANSGGFLLALHEQDLINDFNTVVGDSAGAILAAYGLSGQTDVVQRLFFENANKFIKWQNGKPSIDVDLIANLLKEGEFSLNVQAVLNSKPDFFIAVAGSSGSCEFINAKDFKINLIDLLKASMASPFFYGKKVEINGQSLADPLMDQLPLL